MAVGIFVRVGAKEYINKYAGNILQTAISKYKKRINIFTCLLIIEQIAQLQSFESNVDKNKYELFIIRNFWNKRTKQSF